MKVNISLIQLLLNVKEYKFRKYLNLGLKSMINIEEQNLGKISSISRPLFKKTTFWQEFNPILREESNRPSWLHLEKEGNSIMHVQWALDHVPGSHGDNTATAKLASWTDKHDSILRIPVTKNNVIILYVVNDLCNLCGTHWCRLQCITSWPFWLWIMAVTWLYLPLTFSRLGLRNLGMWAWAVHLRYIRFSQNSVGFLS